MIRGGWPQSAMSRDATSPVMAGGEGGLGGEGPVAVAEEDADGVVVLVGDDDVGFSVAVDVGDDGIVRAGTSGERELGREGGDGGGEKDAAFELLDDATGCAEG